MKKTKKIQYSLEHFYPDFDRQKFFDLFVDPKAWSESDILQGTITINKPGKDYPQGLGAIRTLQTGSMSIKEDIVGFESPKYFSYATYNGSLPVNDFGGELFFEEKDGGVLIKYKGGFNPKYFGTGWIFKYFFSSAQKGVFKKLGQAYNALYGS